MPEYMMKNLFNDGKYQEAISLASDLAVRNQFNEWDYFFLSKCLYAQKDYEGYLALYKEFNKKFPNSTLLNNNMGWSVYHVYLKNFDYERGNRRLYYERVDYIIKTCDDNEYSPKKFIAQRAVDDIFKQKLSVNINYQLANQYLSVIDPMKLETTEQVVEVDGRKIKIASIQDYTSDKVNIEIRLQRGVYTKDVVDALYAFTDCEQTVYCNLLVIKDNMPVQMTCTQVIEYHSKQLLGVLKDELELEKRELTEKLHLRTIERIFVEERIYKKIETQKTEEGVIKAVNHILAANTPLFESLINRLEDYPEMKKSLYQILTKGERFSFNLRKST